MDAPDLVVDRDRPLEVSFANENGRYVLTILGLGRVEGAPARTAHELKPEFDEDRQGGLPRTEHRYVATGTLAHRLKLKDAVLQNVRRCRTELARFYHEVHGSAPPHPLLIENSKGRGYRLDPDIRLIDSNDS